MDKRKEVSQVIIQCKSIRTSTLTSLYLFQFYTIVNRWPHDVEISCREINIRDAC